MSSKVVYDELKSHNHASSKVISKATGKKRTIKEAALELANHYIFVHNKKYPVMQENQERSKDKEINSDESDEEDEIEDDDDDDDAEDENENDEMEKNSDIENHDDMETD